MATRSRRLLGWFGVFAAFALATFALSPLWLPLVGTSLEKAGPPHRADVAVVLGGDVYGDRILTAAELTRAGYVPKVLVSGPSGMYGFYECDLAIAFARKQGWPESIFVRAPNDARSTREETATLAPVLRRMGVRSFLLVTSDFHTRRAGNQFRAAAPDLTMYVVAAADKDFQLNRWWKAREGRKYVLLEWLKTVANWFGM